jgi:hypothetical protein
MTAPTNAGTHIGYWRLSAPNGTSFGTTVWASIRVTGAPAAAPTVAATPGAGACTNNSAFVSDITIPDGTLVTPGQQFNKTWRIRNSGTCPWGEGYTLAFERGTAMTTTTSVAVPATAAGATADVTVALTAPTAPGTYIGHWRMKNPNGTAFGTNVWVSVRIGAPAAAPPLAPGTACTNRATFVSDVTIPDGAPMTAGQQFNKVWRIRNSGTCAWGDGYALVFARGTALTGTTTVPVPNAAPGTTVDVQVPMTAPSTPGTFNSTWRSRAPDGIVFGDAVWAIVRVMSGPAAAPPLVPGPGTRPGIYATNLVVNPSRPVFREPVEFRVTIANTTGSSQTNRWLVKIYQCQQEPCPLDNLRRSIGETPTEEISVPPGTTEIVMPPNWKVGEGACTYFAVPFLIRPGEAEPTPIVRADGTVFVHTFKMC